MIATITQTTPPPSPDPSTPFATSPLPPHISEPDLLTDSLAAQAPLLALCELHDIQLDDLLRCLDHPRTSTRPPADPATIT